MKNMTEWLSPIFMLLVGGYLLAQTYFENKKYDKVRTEGIEVISQPLTQYTEYTHESGSKYYTVDVTYQTKNNETFTKRGIHINQSTIDKANNETPVLKLRYLADDPEFVAVEGSEEESDNETFKFVGFMLILAGIIYGLIIAFNLWRRKRKNQAST